MSNGKWITGHEADIEATENGPQPTAEEMEQVSRSMELDEEGRSVIADLFSGDDEKAKAALQRSYDRAARRASGQ